MLSEPKLPYSTSYLPRNIPIVKTKVALQERRNHSTDASHSSLEFKDFLSDPQLSGVSFSLFQFNPPQSAHPTTTSPHHPLPEPYQTKTYSAFVSAQCPCPPYFQGSYSH